jgi:hypothetical protein
LVTFIACEIVTGGRLTKILGTHPARFFQQGVTGTAAAFEFGHAALQYRAVRPDASFAPPGFPANME